MDIKRGLPLFALDVHTKCNLTCSYCVSGSSPAKDFGPMGDPELLEQMKRFFSTHGPFSILFTGGEPLITPTIFDFFEYLLEFRHRIVLQSNLKIGADRFMWAVPADRVDWILSTFHSVELARFDRYLTTVCRLRDSGYPVVVKLLLDAPMLPHFAQIHDRLAVAGIGVLLSPLILFPPDEPPRPARYSSQMWKSIEPRIHTRATWLYFAGGFRSTGVRCAAGVDYFYGHTATGGSISGCAHNFPSQLGNVFDNQLRTLSALPPCGLEQCCCDFHYYTGMIPAVNDREGFAALLRGENRSVPYAEYLKWLNDSQIQAVISEPLFAEVS